ncbi:MAG: tRNA uridine-5-carboxymethylaminomethyl(34) synthesis GTPase MnmE [Hyphomicrobiaceae bacterium]
MSIDRKTIAALSSAPGKAGVAVVRVSGPGAAAALEGLAGRLPRPRVAALRTLQRAEDGQDIDRAIVLWFPGPSSFTGEDVAEIHLHGGRAVVASVLEALTALGCRLAEPGEFARRAFENGKIDLTEAEGIADLIDAETEAQRVQAIRQATGSLNRLYENWRHMLVSAQALMEAAIDFSDEPDVASDAIAQSRSVAEDLAAAISAHLADGRRGEILRDGFRVVLAGAPNAGKSSLLNALARRDVAIVSPEAGTTRDVIEVRLDLEGLPVIVSDTAGIRDAGGAIEQEGIRRAYAHGRAADLVVWMCEATAPIQAVPDDLIGDGHQALLVRSKCDLASGIMAMPRADGDEGRDVIALSVVTGEGLNDLVRRIAEVARERIAPGESAALTQARHRAALEECAAILGKVLAGDAEQAEIRAEELRMAAVALGRITGRIGAEDVLDHVFGRFCIGK